MTDKSDKQAYLLMAHSNLEQLNFLIRSLDSEFSDIFLHLDAKSKINPDEIVRPVSSQLYFCDRINVYWAEYSQVQCELNLLRLATRIGKYNYYHLISGMDFPLKNQKEIHTMLRNRNDIFIHFTTHKNVELTIPLYGTTIYLQKQLCVSKQRSYFFYLQSI